MCSVSNLLTTITRLDFQTTCNFHMWQKCFKTKSKRGLKQSQPVRTSEVSLEIWMGRHGKLAAIFQSAGFCQLTKFE